MYPSDLPDFQWSKLEPLLAEPVGDRHAGGRPRKYPFAAGDRRGVVCGEDGLSVAAVAGGFSSLADGVYAVSVLAFARNLRAGDQVLAGTGP